MSSISPIPLPNAIAQLAKVTSLVVGESYGRGGPLGSAQHGPVPPPPPATTHAARRERRGLLLGPERRARSAPGSPIRSSCPLTRRSSRAGVAAAARRRRRDHCARMTDGTIQCCGANGAGALGTDTTELLSSSFRSRSTAFTGTRCRSRRAERAVCALVAGRQRRVLGEQRKAVSSGRHARRRRRILAREDRFLESRGRHRWSPTGRVGFALVSLRSVRASPRSRSPRAATTASGFDDRPPGIHRARRGGAAAPPPGCGFRCSRDLKKVLQGATASRPRSKACPRGAGLRRRQVRRRLRERRAVEGLGRLFVLDAPSRRRGSKAPAPASRRWSRTPGTRRDHHRRVRAATRSTSASRSTRRTMVGRGPDLHASSPDRSPPGRGRDRVPREADDRDRSDRGAVPGRGQAGRLKVDPIRHGTTKTKAFHLKTDVPVVRVLDLPLRRSDELHPDRRRCSCRSRRGTRATSPCRPASSATRSSRAPSGRRCRSSRTRTTPRSRCAQRVDIVRGRRRRARRRPARCRRGSSRSGQVLQITQRARRHGQPDPGEQARRRLRRRAVHVPAVGRSVLRHHPAADRALRAVGKRLRARAVRAAHRERHGQGPRDSSRGCSSAPSTAPSSRTSRAKPPGAPDDALRGAGGLLHDRRPRHREEPGREAPVLRRGPHDERDLRRRRRRAAGRRGRSRLRQRRPLGSVPRSLRVLCGLHVSRDRRSRWCAARRRRASCPWSSSAAGRSTGFDAARIERRVRVRLGHADGGLQAPEVREGRVRLRPPRSAERGAVLRSPCGASARTRATATRAAWEPPDQRRAAPAGELTARACRGPPARIARPDRCTYASACSDSPDRDERSRAHRRAVIHSTEMVDARASRRCAGNRGQMRVVLGERACGESTSLNLAPRSRFIRLNRERRE